MYHGRCVAVTACILILLSILSELPSNALPHWQDSPADAKFTGSTEGVKETQSIPGPTIQDFHMNTTQCNAPVQWNFSLTDSYGLKNATFWWNNSTNDMGNTTIDYSATSPTSANSLFNATLPSTAQNVTFQAWAYNAYTSSTTGVRWMLVYPSNTSFPYFLNLGTAISTIENANNWVSATSDPGGLYAGIVLNQNHTDQIQSYLDSFVATEDWTDILKWSAITNKLGFTLQTDIKYALGNYTMIGTLPQTAVTADTELYPNQPAFCTEDKWALYAYWYNNNSWMGSYQNNTKWNITAAYQLFNSSVYARGDPVLYVLGNGYAWPHYINPDQPRYYDECASTIECYILFSKLLNVSGAMNDALHWWNYTDKNLWSSGSAYGGYYRYTNGTVDPVFECESTFFLKIISILKYYNANLTDWFRVLEDTGSRFLSKEWSSYQWDIGLADFPTTSYVIVHKFSGNEQRRLQNTLGAWQSLLGIWKQMNTTYQNDMVDMLLGNIGTVTRPAWNLLLSNGYANLFDSGSNLFKWSSDVTTSFTATAWTEVLMWMMGIVPGNTTVAFPLEELTYEYYYDVDPAIFQNYNSTARQIFIPVNSAGTLTFQYGCSPITYYFNQSGLWLVNFTNSWNNIASVQRLGKLPTNMIYFQNIVTTPTHDLAVVDVTSSKTVVGQGYSQEIEVIVANHGTFNETFNVTAYADNRAMGTQQVSSLNGMDQTTLTFTWNTSELAYNNYTISAYAVPVPGETNTVNNNFTGGAVTVTIPGDINGDFKVGPQDLVLLQNAYGSTPQMPSKWNPDADIDGNGVVDLTDLVTLAMHYGQHNP